MRSRLLTPREALRDDKALAVFLALNSGPCDIDTGCTQPGYRWQYLDGTGDLKTVESYICVDCLSRDWGLDDSGILVRISAKFKEG